MHALLAVSFALVASLAVVISGQDTADASCVGASCHAPPRGTALIQKGSLSDRMVAGGDFADGEDYDPWKAEMKYKFEHLHRSNSARDMLKYFKEWSKGEVRHRAQVHKNLDHHLGASLLRVDQGVSASYVANVLGSHRELFCPGAANEKTAGGWKGDATSLGDKWRLHSTSTDVEGVHHALLLSSGGRPHYVAMLDGRVLSSDPPACPHGRGLLHEAALLENRSLNFTHRGELPNANAGEQELLDDHDPLAQDAVIDFRHFYKKTCGTNIDVTILSAQVEMIDGVEAIVDAQLNDAECVTIKVAFRFPGNITNPLGLIGVSNTSDPVHPAPGTVDDPNGTNFVHDIFVADHDINDLCTLGQSGGSRGTCKKAALMQKYKFGDNSKEKGSKWEMDLIPKMYIPSLIGAATQRSSVDLRTDYSACFPGSNYAGVIRNQGTCGSCWAMAAATAMMHNLCISSSSPNLKSGGGRKEVSVQQIMSCNSGQRGCQGGNAASAGSAASAQGLDREADAPYQCGSGNPLNHFTEASSCDAAPWGATCQTSLDTPAWNYYGVQSVSGEAGMMSMLGMGQALYVRFDVWRSFMGRSWQGSVYTGPNDGRTGGHAVVAIGYGVSAGTKYWWLQNSWGSSWNENGYCKFQRGVDLCGIESGAQWLKTDNDGGTPAPCFDGSGGPYGQYQGSTFVPYSCAEQSSWCSQDSVKASCPVTCGQCTASPTPPPAATTTPTPAPPTPAPPAPTPYVPNNPTQCLIADPNWVCVGGSNCLTHANYAGYTDLNGDPWCLTSAHALCQQDDAAWGQGGCTCPTQTQHACGRCPPRGTPPPTAAPPPTSPAAWTVRGAGCTKSSDGCVTSNNYPLRYSDSKSCTITGFPTIGTVGFETENNYDKLVVNGQTYSGRTGPAVGLAPTADITWAADRSVVKKGWKLCPAAASPTAAPATNPPTGAPATNPPTDAPATNPPTGAPATNPPTGPATNPPTGAPATNPPTGAPPAPGSSNPSDLLFDALDSNHDESVSRQEMHNLR
jgi:C1A family cysteine protease